MKDKIEFITVCPELDIGLGVPRESLRLVIKNDKIDEKFLDSISQIDCIFPEIDYNIYR